MSKTLYASVTGISDIESITVSTAHSASTATAQIVTANKTVNIGDHIEIDIGYTTNHAKVMQGYVKNISRIIPNDLYTIIVKDDLVRATDYFIVPTNPDNSFKRSNISAEDLVEDVINLAGLTNYTFDATSFTFATKAGNEVEVKLTTSYDFCKMISDLLTWHLWADSAGQIHFENRKPFVMSGASGQPGDTDDERVDGYAFNDASPLTNDTILSARYLESDRDLRNRVVVHGSTGIYSEDSNGQSWNPITQAYEDILPTTPTQFYKSMALVSHFIDNQSMADKSTEYNLDLYNKLTVGAQITAEGDPAYLARKIMEIDQPALSLTGNWYIFQADHSWSRNGYIMDLELRL
jgi:hypothetical protein